MDYPLCDQTVTIYRKHADQVLRLVAYGCYFSCRDTMLRDENGSRQSRSFLLVMPGNIQRVFPGDRVCPGEGPQVAAQDWDRFLPVLVPGLVQVAYTKPFYWNGKLCHVEAGNG